MGSVETALTSDKVLARIARDIDAAPDVLILPKFSGRPKGVRVNSMLWDDYAVRFSVTVQLPLGVGVVELKGGAEREYVEAQGSRPRRDYWSVEVDSMHLCRPGSAMWEPCDFADHDDCETVRGLIKGLCEAKYDDPNDEPEGSGNE